MTAPSPGPAPDRAAAEQRLRDIADGWTDTESLSRDDAAAVLAELARLRSLIAAVLAECERRESPFSGPAYTEKWVETHRIRALLEGDGP